jgi:hypothetical protein
MGQLVEVYLGWGFVVKASVRFVVVVFSDFSRGSVNFRH